MVECVVLETDNLNCGITGLRLVGVDFQCFCKECGCGAAAAFDDQIVLLFAHLFEQKEADIRTDGPAMKVA